MESLRSALQPLTHSLPEPITNFGRSLIGPYCYKTLILDIDPFKEPDCVKLAVSKGLGIAIIGASSVVKIPQLIKLISSGSAEGVSFLSYFLESSAYLISLVYNIRHGFPFSTYGETALILVQNVFISIFVLRYTDRGSWTTMWIAGLMAAGAVMWRPDLVPVKTMSWLQAFSGVLGVASKVPQIVTIFEQGGTGQLSAFAVSVHRSSDHSMSPDNRGDSCANL
jgi:mannose-P-dolichol utilization defect protein 1